MVSWIVATREGVDPYRPTGTSLYTDFVSFCEDDILTRLQDLLLLFGGQCV
jgi:hypothetical protein